MKTYKSSSAFGAVMKLKSNRANSNIQLIKSRSTRRAIKRQKGKHTINL
jgi:hypothetical protein